MRLLNVETYQLEEFFEPQIPHYAILSHRWEHEEITYVDIQARCFAHKKASRKLKYTCEQAVEDALKYVWIDFLCIDKSSSADLSEAVNSMLHDFAPLSRHPESFPQSAWFTRGWTLQELIALRTVQFYSKDWSFIGTREDLSDQIFKLAGITKRLLQRRDLLDQTVLFDYSVAQRMSWAANRQTTRVEDRAYSLMDLFGVNMPLLYGEGEYAFIRLQEEILKVGVDLSILAWESDFRSSANKRTPLLASSPSDFKDCGRVRLLLPSGELGGSGMILTMTNIGLRIEGAYLVDKTGMPRLSHGDILVLGFWDETKITESIGLRLRTPVIKSTRPEPVDVLSWMGS